MPSIFVTLDQSAEAYFSLAGISNRWQNAISTLSAVSMSVTKHQIFTNKVLAPFSLETHVRNARPTGQRTAR